MKKILCSVAIILAFIYACSSEDNNNTGEEGNSDAFDRSALLINVADNIIIPAYQSFDESMETLSSAVATFVETTNEENLDLLHSAWEDAYVAWQSVSMFEIGKAEELSYRNFMNVYPVDASAIDANIVAGEYDLTSVSKQDEQGFGALDYLLNNASNEEIVASFSSEESGMAYKTYLSDVVDRMVHLTDQVRADWEGDYRDTFVNNSGASATSSLDKLTNDFIFHYEKHLRAGKIGIPAGVFSGDVLADRVEGYYRQDISKQLFMANLNALQDFFNGKYFESSTTGEGLKTYLDALNTLKDGESLSEVINNQFDVSREIALELNDNFSEQVTTDNTLMTSTYDALQENVVFLKVDMLSALSISVDFIDADGD